MKTTKFTHEWRIQLRYMIEMLAAFLFYAVVLVISIDVGRPMRAGLERALIEVSPMVPVLVVIAVIARHFRRLDEYCRLRALESMAISFAVTAGWTFTYGFLENSGFPRLSMFTVWEVMGPVWALVAIFRWPGSR
jgi:hypothetical protein